MNMKKMFVALALGAAFMLPLSASAMSPLTDSELSAVRGTGQPDVSMDVNTDGIGSTAALLKNGGGSSQLNATGQSGASVNSETRRSGVSIYFDVTVNIHFDVIAWGDADGFGTTGAAKAGYVGLSQANVTGLRIGPRN